MRARHVAQKIDNHCGGVIRGTRAGKRAIPNNEPCMILEVLTKTGWVSLDATRCIDIPGRLIDQETNKTSIARPYKAMLIIGKWRVGFIRTRDLVPGDELTWEYVVLPLDTPETKRKRFTGE